jgi:hypothetical protein
LGAPRYRTVQNILATGLEHLPLDEPASRPAPVIPFHANLRGAAYYADRRPTEAAAASAESGEIARASL